MKTLHEQLVEKALPHIEAFQKDLLVHDKDELERYPGRPFLHFTGDTGTTIVTLYRLEDYPSQGEVVPFLFGRADRWHILKGQGELLNALPQCNRLNLVLWYNGEELEEITHERAKSLMAEYTRKMRASFSAERS